MKNKLQLGVLAYAWPSNKLSPSKVLRQTITFAKEIEEMGLSSCWFTEHHEPGIAWSCPDILVGPVAQATRRLRVGTAGVQLLAYNPLKLANDFKCLSALYPGRIGLGLGSGLIGINHLALAKVVPRSKEELGAMFREKVRTLVRLLEGHVFQTGEFKGCKAFPDGKDLPEIWVLGMGGLGFKVANELKLNYFHGLLTDRQNLVGENKIRLYGSDKTKGTHRKCITAGIICAPTEDLAQKALRRSMKLASIKTALPQLMIVGTPDQCRRELLAIQNEYKTNEIIIRTLNASQEEVLDRFNLVAKACRLK